MRSIFTFAIAALILTACSQTPALATPTHISTVTPIALPSFTSTPQAVEPTPELTPTPEAPQWITSPDNSVMWTKEGMANGELAVRPEKSKELRDDTIRALWAVNNALVNPEFEADTPQNIKDDHAAFLKQFPSAKALIKYVEEEGAPIDIYIPVNNSKALGAKNIQSCQVQLLEGIDLSQVVVGFDISPRKDLWLGDDYFDYKYTEDAFCDFGGTVGQLLIEPVVLSDGKTILSWKFRNEADMDSVKNNIYNRLQLYQEQLPEDKLRAASQLANMTLDATMALEPNDAEVNKAYDPAVVLLNYAKMFYLGTSSDPISNMNPDFRPDYYLKAASAENSYFEVVSD